MKNTDSTQSAMQSGISEMIKRAMDSCNAINITKEALQIIADDGYLDWEMDFVEKNERERVFFDRDTNGFSLTIELNTEPFALEWYMKINDEYVMDLNFFYDRTELNPSSKDLATIMEDSINKFFEKKSE